MGSPEGLTVVTMHVLVRAPQAAKAAGEGGHESGRQGCAGRPPNVGGGVVTPPEHHLLLHCLCGFLPLPALLQQQRKVTQMRTPPSRAAASSVDELCHAACAQASSGEASCACATAHQLARLLIQPTHAAALLAAHLVVQRSAAPAAVVHRHGSCRATPHRGATCVFPTPDL
jgi:hypothetical protein